MLNLSIPWVSPITHLRLARRDEVLGVEEGLLDGLAAAERAAVPQHHHLN